MQENPQTSPALSLLTVDQAMKALGICRSTIYSLINTGKLRTVRIGKARRVSPQAIADFIRESEARTTSRAA